MSIEHGGSAQSEIGNRQWAMVDVINRQRRSNVNAKQWREFGERALKAIGAEERNVSIVFVSDVAIRKLNAQFRGKDYATDVLSFPAQSESFETDAAANLGEVVISIARAQAQAKANGLALNTEIEQLVLHGLLHLAGYDHETDNGQMNRLELSLRKKLRI